MISTLKIEELSYLEASDGSQCSGGYADANATTDAGPGYAIAIATADAEGQFTATDTRTKTTVRQTKRYIFSRAFAVGTAIAITETGIERDIDRSKSFYKYPITP